VLITKVIVAILKGPYGGVLPNYVLILGYKYLYGYAVQILKVANLYKNVLDFFLPYVAYYKASNGGSKNNFRHS
jgi:hypothetical protein